jgi:hypothetical protein
VRLVKRLVSRVWRSRFFVLCVSACACIFVVWKMFAGYVLSEAIPSSIPRLFLALKKGSKSQPWTTHSDSMPPSFSTAFRVPLLSPFCSLSHHSNESFSPASSFFPVTILLLIPERSIELSRSRGN